MKRPRELRLPTFFCLALAFTLLPETATRAESEKPVEAHESDQDRATRLLRQQIQDFAGGEVETLRSRLEEAQRLFQQAGDEYGQAKCLLLIGILETQRGHPEKALYALKQGAQRLETVGDYLGAWFGLIQTAEAYQQLRQYSEAAETLEQASGLLHLLSEPGVRLQLEIPLLVVGVLGAPDLDLPPFEDPFGLLKRMLLPLMRMGTLDTLGVVLMEEGRFEEADRQFELASRVPAIAGKSLVLLHWGQLRRRQMRPAQGREFLQRALDKLSESTQGIPIQVVPQGLLSAAKDNSSSLKIQILRELSEVDMLTGDLDTALVFNDEARALAEKSGPLLAIEVVEDRVRFLSLSGRIQEAREALTAAEDLAATPNGNRLRGVLLKRRGSLSLLSGELQDAIHDFELADPLLQTFGDNRDLLENQLLVAETYFLLGDKDIAGKWLARARNLLQQMGNSVAEPLAQTLEAMLASSEPGASSDRLYSHLKEALALAEEHMDLALLKPLIQSVAASPRSALDEATLLETRKVAKQGESGLLVGLTDVALGMISWQRGEVAASRSHFHRAIISFETEQNLELEAWSRGIAGLLESLSGNSDRALRLLRSSFETFEKILSQIRVEELLTNYLDHRERQSLFGATVGLLALQGQERDAFLFSERARAQALLGLLGNQTLRSRSHAITEQGKVEKGGSEIEVLRKKLSVLEKPGSPSSGTDHAQRLSELDLARANYQTLLVQAKVRDPEYYDLVSARNTIDVKTLQSDLLPPETTLVSYFFTPNLLLVWVVDRESFTLVPVDMTREELDSALCFHAALGHRGGPAFSALEGKSLTRSVTSATSCAGSVPVADLLYRKLIAPIRPLLNHSQLILIPHGPLHYLPFAALKNPVSGRYLMQDFSLSYLPSASVLPFLELKRSPMKGRALVLGAPHRLEPELVPQNGARREAKIVAEILGTKPHLGLQATEALLFQQARTADFVHLAAHGVVLGERPRFSRIALTPDPTSDDDGNLEVHEIFGKLDLEGVNLVVLSACQTSLGRRTEGDEIVGLTRAFFYAGAPTVVSTLWNIDDLASVSLVEGFYRRLQEGLSTTEALRQAQLQALSTKATQDPYFWAAFTLQGLPSIYRVSP